MHLESRTFQAAKASPSAQRWMRTLLSFEVLLSKAALAELYMKPDRQHKAVIGVKQRTANNTELAGDNTSTVVKVS